MGNESTFLAALNSFYFGADLLCAERLIRSVTPRVAHFSGRSVYSFLFDTFIVGPDIYKKMQHIDQYYD